MIAICLCLVVLLFQDADSQKHIGGYPPEELYYPKSAERYMTVVIMNLTTLLAKDATIRLWHADRVQKKYKGTLSYELGTIAAGIQDHFRSMLQTYRKYSNMTDFRFNKYGMEEIMNAYHIMKGNFNGLRMEKAMFDKILNEHKKKLKAAKLAASNPKVKERTKKKSAKALRVGPPNDEELAFKKNLRYEKWAAKLHTFIPEVEGIDIDNLDDKV